VHEITSKQSDIEDPAPIRLITAYRIKGLEFDDVCLAGSCASNWKRDDLESKCLIHVASTRTKNSLKITAPSSISPLFGA
jgi:superfamily I DNA/RNA helicase